MRATVMYGAGDVRIETAAAQITAQGARYAEAQQRMIDR